MKMVTHQTSRAMRIFVLEDNEDTLKYLRRHLERLGHTVVSASTIADSLALFPSSNCEVLISDIGLPDGDGWDFYEEIRPLGNVFAIAMSGYGRPSDHARSKSVGFLFHLVKPFQLSELDQILEKAAQTRTVAL